MFRNGNDINSMQDALERIKNVSDNDAFKWMVRDLRTYLKNLGMDFQAFIELERRAYYLPNEYS